MASKGLRGIHVFWIIAGFFGVIFAVDGLFIVRAVSTFPGEDVTNPFVQGIDFNQTIAQREAQRRLGWTAEIGFDRSSQSLIVRVLDASGAPVEHLDLSASYRTIGRTTEATRTTLKPDARGDYKSRVELKPLSRLEVIAEANRTGDSAIVFRASKTLVVN